MKMGPKAALTPLHVTASSSDNKLFPLLPTATRHSRSIYAMECVSCPWCLSRNHALSFGFYALNSKFRLILFIEQKLDATKIPSPYYYFTPHAWPFVCKYQHHW